MITINSIVASQVSTTNNPGSVNVPSIRVAVNFTHSDGATGDITAEINVNDTWYPAHMLSGWNTLARSSGSTHTVVIDLYQTLSAHQIQSFDGNLPVRITVSETGDPSVNASDTESVPVVLVPPQSPGVVTPEYVGQTQDNGLCIFTVTWGEGSTPLMYRAGLTAAAVAHNGSSSMQVLGGDGDTGSYQFGSTSSWPDGEYTILARLYDQYYNMSALASASTYLLRTAPQSPVVTIIGSTGSKYYTGIAIDENGAFSPDREVTLQLSAISPRPLSYRIATNSNCEPIMTVDGDSVDIRDGEWIPLTPANNQPKLQLCLGEAGDSPPYNANADNYNVSSQVNITVQFNDSAGNTVYGNGTIVLNTRLYTVANTPMRPVGVGYKPQIVEVLSGGIESPIPETLPLSENPVRMWNDIFYPTSHGYPTLSDGTLNAATAKTLSYPQTLYDSVVVDGEIVYDEDNRPVTVGWTADGTKDYTNLLSNSISNLTYWVVDNTGQGDITLEFEHFDLDPNVYGPPYNALSPHPGDVLVVYDASDPGALSVSVDDFGRNVWSLDHDPASNSSLCKELAAYTGRGSSVVNLTNGVSMNSGQNGDFKAGPFIGSTKLVLVLYTDAHKTGSGFKLKAGRSTPQSWTNWHLSSEDGEVWTHKYAGLDQINGLAGEYPKRITYEYLQGKVNVNYDDGIVTFEVPPSGDVTADYSYYGGNHSSNLYLAAHDDFIDYQDAPVFIGAAGESTLSDDTRSSIAGSNNDYGRLTTDYSWDKDRGVVEINVDYLPDGRRIWADYYHHTYKRLSNDGYGDLTFVHPVLVADTTPAFPDYTWSDIKTVNEGSSTLESWKMIFQPRGYDTDKDENSDYAGNIGWAVDQVLNINRPWDIQKGTPAETYNKCAVEMRENFTWDRSCDKATARSILSSHQNRTVSFDLPARSQCFGRVVWVLGGTSGTNYPQTSSGEKRWGMEITGRFYDLNI